MNSTSASTTLFAGLGVTQVADIVTWLTTWPIHAPPSNVSLALAAFLVAAGHAAVNLVRARYPAIAAEAVAPAAPVAAPVEKAA